MGHFRWEGAIRVSDASQREMLEEEGVGFLSDGRVDMGAPNRSATSILLP